jgi:hypothetical protein
MANYPSYEILLASRPTPEKNGIEDDYSQAGTQHSRTFRSQQYYRFAVRHSLTLAEYNSLCATYAAGPRDFYTFTFYNESPVQTYNVKFTGPPEITENLGFNRFIVDVPLRGVKN